MQTAVVSTDREVRGRGARPADVLFRPACCGPDLGYVHRSRPHSLVLELGEGYLPW